MFLDDFVLVDGRRVGTFGAEVSEVSKVLLFEKNVVHFLHSDGAIFIRLLSIESQIYVFVPIS